MKEPLLQIDTMTNDPCDDESLRAASASHQALSHPRRRNYLQWLKVGVYGVFLLAGQSAAILLGRLYYKKGGNSEWMGTLVQLAGFPILLPYYLVSVQTSEIANSFRSGPKSFLTLISVCVCLSLVLAADCFLYAVGMQYLPVSTYSLISASQLAFNALFSFFINSQKFTPYVANSLVLLTFSSILIVFQADSEEDGHKASGGKYALGFVCTVVGSALYGLMLCSTQFAIENVLKRETFSVVVDIAVLESFLATCAALVGLFASGEWKGLEDEMHGFQLGKMSYFMMLIGAAISWQFFNVGTLGLILEVSSLYSNAVGVLGLPIVPVLAVFFFREKMNGVKVIAMMLAIWGFISYVYQNYLDEHGSQTHNVDENKKIRETPESEINT